MFLEHKYLMIRVLGSYVVDYEEYCVLWCDAVQSGRSLPTVWENLFHLSTLKMGETGSSDIYKCLPE